MERVLITGGAGFIGSHLGDLLLRQGYAVRLFDSLDPQIHAENRRPTYLDRDMELHVGDMRDPAAVARAVQGVDAVVHLAACVGVGQSMYEMAKYVGVNDLGTAVLLEALMRHPVGRLVVASSMSVYGEGLGRAPDGALVEPAERGLPQLRAGRWEPVDGQGRALEPLPTPEGKRPTLSSIYALTKFAQERACLMFGQAYGVPTAAMRLYNVFGTRQALSNPYTGVIAIFASRILNGRPPHVFEDGQQRRDFVHVRDVARAFLAALRHPGAGGQVFNVGSGAERTIESVALSLARALGRPEIRPELSGRYRAGDIRHCFADMRLARELLGFVPQEAFEPALVELAEWLADAVAIDHVDRATSELVERGLVA